MKGTLILNADAQPLSVLPLSVLDWEDAIKIMYLDRVDVLHEYSDWEVHSPSVNINVPSVMILKDYIQVNRNVKFSKYNVFLRDSFECQYCGEYFPVHLLTLDHVVPRDMGGKTSWENSVAACESCNVRKANKTHMKPNMKPYRPSYFDLIGKRKKFPIHIHDSAWRDYIDWEPSLIIEN